MYLDSEEQRSLLLTCVKNLPLQGSAEQMAVALQELEALLWDIECAEIYEEEWEEEE